MGTNYYVDYTNGADAKDGIKIGNFTAEASTDTTHIYVTEDSVITTDGAADDYLNGDFLYNITRSIGVIITDYQHADGSGHTIITHPAIAGQVSTDTFFVIRSKKTIENLTENSRAAGDIIYIRGGQTHSQGSDITFTSSGTALLPIEIIGCYDGVTDPWYDGATTRPVIDFGAGDYHFILSTKHWWKFVGLDIFNGSTRCLEINTSEGIVIENVIIHNSGTYGMVVSSGATVTCIGCDFHDNGTQSIGINASIVKLKSCTLNGSGVNGITSNASMIYMEDCTFGITNQYSTTDISTGYNSKVYGRNCILNSTTPVTYSTSTGMLSEVCIEDNGQVQGAFIKYVQAGVVVNTTAINRSGDGGTAWSVLGTPTSLCCENKPLIICGDAIRGIPLYLDGTSQTITMYAYADATGAWAPTNAEFYFELDYHSASGVRTKIRSTDAFAAKGGWEAFTITVDPDAAGVAHLKAVLTTNVAGGLIYIDPTPVFS